ncbi:hypothetical protein N7478_000957 [Penicillium angulare]|uniref:uncharacterized protein n=1 Tax=Penicillium angulare TaxID=116970 RepID=UPI00253FE2B8|nr:uncharacterized protein N7478_000957 [Penicillium angulare]KAJ5291706.1 hypothetical protein N7478_000957 [Penicillium angulare]
MTNTPTPPLLNTPVSSPSVDAARQLLRQLDPIFEAQRNLPTFANSEDLDFLALSSINIEDTLSAIKTLLPTLTPQSPIFASFHDGQVHNPLGGGSYAFQKDLVGPILRALIVDEGIERDHMGSHDGNFAPKVHLGDSLQVQVPTRPIIIHAGAQPNNSPHAGTLVVFCYAFALARKIRDRMQDAAGNISLNPLAVSVQITFVDTAPVNGQQTEISGIQYQRSHRATPGALETHMGDYEQILRLLSTWSNIPFSIDFQSDFFRSPAMPSIMRYIIENRILLGHQLSPKYGKLALRAACPHPGCGIAEKHGQLNTYTYNYKIQADEQDPFPLFSSAEDAITFQCPHHGRHAICISNPADIARLEANAPIRNLIRSICQLMDTEKHHVRVTGADYAGMYQEMLLYRPLALWSAATGLALGRTPHIAYAPLIVDWSGAKLSKSLYVREGGYEAMRMLGTEGLCSFAQLKMQFGGDEQKGLRRLWEEVKMWLEDPKKLFRTFSVEYLHRVIMQGQKWM